MAEFNKHRDDRHYKPVNKLRNQRAQIESQVEEFLKSGGEIEELEIRVPARNDKHISFAEAVKISGITKREFVTSTANTNYFGIRVPMRYGGKAASYRMSEVEEFAAKIAEFKRGKVA